MELDFEIIFGLHSIAEALKNDQRIHEKLYATDEGLLELQKKHQINPKHLKVKIEILSSHLLQEKAKKYFSQMDLEFVRVPSQIFLKTSPVEIFELKEFIKRPKLKMLALDQITDVHNGGAILRTAAFYGVDAILIPGSKTFGMTPSFYRISSGAVEHVKLIRVSSLSKAISQINEAGIQTIGLSEHVEKNLGKEQIEAKVCLVLGAEETGLSHAVERLVKEKMSLQALGQIKSLNVSTAAAIAMEKCFG